MPKVGIGQDNQKITCPYCKKRFENNGRPEIQKCPRCHSSLLTGRGTK